ncbi:cyclosome subunit-like protein [Leishmania major strain Friedlin]|uniref:Cyclosome subunit-like protein n=1 Tax=Leishmania major TaxID=5664 RepID=Q4Q795_LEIMA|nr:cyclosome subunit-like protein [Leishmania major strain Friedlin]CAG9578432.1 cyclosome_subunit-like_protein [Leishmania major strain Friedlin]CAJ06383.1 cyclosome subunit-like protein [Leishmania major strain Friedlin]|eukprot:XP_001684803.1 cyclosome subunit-like protein [Leishmania major strain Friedlin]
MSLSPYTIDVGPCKADGRRDVFLQCHQRPCFSTTHRGITRVCLAKWPARSRTDMALETNDVDESEALRAQRTEQVYQTLLEFGDPQGPPTSPQLMCSDHDAAGNDTDVRSPLEQYLCVFHREELADQYGRYTFVQPHTICTAYRIADSTVLELVLHNITPTDISAAATGVFVRGHRQSSKGLPSSTPLEYQGIQYKPASNLWWMGAPLSLKPVYVAVPLGPQVGATGGAPKGSVDKASGSHADGIAAADSDHGDKAAGDTVSRPVASPTSVGADDAATQRETVDNTSSPLLVELGGRTAQGQFQFRHSRSSSPNMCCPSQSAVLPAEGQVPPVAAAASSPSLPRASLPLVSNAQARYVAVEATVLAQLELFDLTAGSCTCASSLAVVRTGDAELGLATTTPQYALDCMLWQWWPHRVRLPRLASGNAALSAVASLHAALDRYAVFVYDAHHSHVFVLRTPYLHSGTGAFELLFSFPCGSLPFVLPCLRAPHPAPIAVCNYPRPNCISVYDVMALLDAPAAATVAMELDLETYQANHSAFFGKVCTSSSDDDSALFGGADILSTNGNSARGVMPAPPLPTGAADNAMTRSVTAASWRADAINGVPHPIRSILYHYENRLVVQYAWPSGSAQPAAMESADDAGAVFASSCGSGEYEADDDQGVRSRHRRRRRCEGTVSFTVEFPAITLDQDPLLVFVLEALSAALGARAVATLEYILFAELWDCKCRAAVAVDAFDLCARLLRKIFRCECGDCDPALACTSARAHLQQAAEDPETTGCGGETMTEAAAPHVFVDPSTVTLQQIRRTIARRRTGDAPARWRRGAVEEESGTTSVVKTTVPVRWGAINGCAWTRQERGLALVALHLLFEACRAQEHLWSLLPRLASVNRDLSNALQWPSYVEYYDAMCPRLFAAPSPPSQISPTQSFTDSLPASVLQCHFDTLERPDNAAALRASCAASVAPSATEFATGDAPSLFSALSLAAMRSSILTCVAVPYGTWPLLKHLPDAHPIALVNRVVLLYRDIFGASAGSLTVTSASSVGTSRGDVLVDSHVDATWWQRICSLVLQRRISSRVVWHTLNAAAAYPLLEALTKGRECADSTWPAALLELVGRRDRCPPTSRTAQISSAGQHVVETAEENAVSRQFRVALTDDDGVSVRPDFRKTWRDSRLDMVQNLFNTVAPISLSGFEDRPEELTGALELLSCRTRATPLGRGMLTMCTQSFKVQDSIPIAPLNLNGRTNDGINVASKPVDDLMWPLFHNGCAAGLRFLPLPPAFCAGAGDAPFATQDALGDMVAKEAAALSLRNVAQSITKQWVMYQTKNIGDPASRAGLLLATGILGHLTVLQRTDIFYLLISRQEQYVWREATTMAVMLGLSCSFCGTGNEAVFRCLSVHVQSLNPSAEDIEVSLDVQTAALVSMGLLCQQSPSNSFLVEVFLVELSRMPTDEHCTKREGYVLGAGFGLGQLLLGVGQSHGVQRVEDRLLAIMRGGPRSAAVSTRDGVEHFEETMGRGEAGHFLTRALLSQDEREATYNACASVYEGDCYNVFVSGPAAAVALGMMYLRTDNAFIASRMAPPNRRAAMQKLTPLMCHLRSTMASLIGWTSIEPTRLWLYNQVPSSLLELTQASLPRLATQQINYLLMNLAHCIAGHVMAIGLRFAGTMDSTARDLIFAELQGFLAGQVGSTKAAIPAVQRSTGAYEACLLACANALSLVMAGTGDLRALALLQQLHRRTNVPYGSHMAISMSIGLLFLGSGRLTLCNNITAVAALLMAFYPVWPKDAEDNTGHLQALRHLYGLAVVPRIMEAVDAVSHQPVPVPVRIVLRKKKSVEMEADVRAQQRTSRAAASAAVEHAEDTEQAIHTVTPCLYPPVEMIERVEVRGTQYYPLVFYAFSKELTQSAGMLFRVMAKESASSPVHGRGGGRALSTRTSIESRLLGWLHRLFRQSSTTMTEALTIIDSVKLVLRVQRPLLSRTTGGGELLLSGDFGEAVAEAMERRYAFIFLHGGVPAVEGVSSDPHHPLRQLILEGKSRAEVFQSIVRHPQGTVAFPCDFTALAFGGTFPANWGGETTVTPMLPAERNMCPIIDTDAVARWMTEALHYYGIGQREIALLRQATTTLSTPAAGSPMGTSREGASSVQRLTALLRLQATTLLPLATLEKIWACCVD